MDGENNGKPLLKWMIWGYHYFRKHPFITPERAERCHQDGRCFQEKRRGETTPAT